MNGAALRILALCVAVFTGCVFGGGQNGKHPGKADPLPPVELTASTDRTTATISDPITYRLTATCSPGVTADLPEVGAEIAGLRVVDFGEEGPRGVDGRTEHTRWYTLRADVAGSYIIPSLPVVYRDKDGGEGSIKTPQIFIRVTTTGKDTGAQKSTDILDIKPLEEVQRDMIPYVLSGAAALLIIAGIIAAVLYRDRRNKHRDAAARPAHVLALEALDRLHREHLIEKGAVREHFFGLSDIFRRYIEDRFSVAAVEQTTQELLPVLRGLPGVEAGVKKEAEEFLAGSDLVKFARYIPASDSIEREHERMLAIIDATKVEETDLDTEQS